MWNAFIIKESLKKQKSKVLVIIIQLIFIFLAINFAILLINKSKNIDDDFSKLTDLEKGVLINLYFNKKVTPHDIEEINFNKDELGVEKILNYASSEWNLKELNKGDKYNKNIKVYLIPAKDISYYNFKLSNNINEKNEENIEILIGNNLKKYFEIGEVFNKTEFINNQQVVRSYKVLDIIKNEKFWSTNIGGVKTIEDLNDSIIIPIDNIKKEDFFIQNNFFFRNINVIFKTKETKDNFVENIKGYQNKDFDIRVIESNQLLNQIRENNKVWLNIIFIIATLIFILALIGIIGFIISYIDERAYEFGVRFLLGANKTNLRNLIIGEILIIYIFSNTISFSIINLITKNEMLSNYIPKLDFKSMVFSYIIIILISIITAIIPLTYIVNKKPVDLIKGVK